MNDTPGERGPFVIQRAHGRAPNVDGQRADQEYRAKNPAPDPDPAREPARQIRQARQGRQAPAPSHAPTTEVPKKERAVPPHELVLADLRDQRDAIDTAIQALEALYR